MFQYVPAIQPDARHPSEDEVDLDSVAEAKIKRSSADTHKIDLHKRKRFKRKKPSLPIYFELTAFEASLLQLQQKLAKVKSNLWLIYSVGNNCSLQSSVSVRENNCKVAHTGTQTMSSDQTGHHTIAAGDKLDNAGEHKKRSRRRHEGVEWQSSSGSGTRDYERESSETKHSSSSSKPSEDLTREGGDMERDARKREMEKTERSKCRKSFVV